MPPPAIENQASSLLSTEENLQVFKLLGSRCQTIATTVVQLFTAPPNSLQWFKKDTGVLCFVKDFNKKNYFFRLFSLKRNQLAWETEIYNNMEYSEAAPFFHTFEGDDCIVAFNFANLPEANEFKAVVKSKIAAKKRKEEKRSKPINQYQTHTINPISHEKIWDTASKQEFQKKKRMRNITKADIGTPTGFVHVSHVGWNPDTGFDVLSEDAQLKALFQKAGVSEKQLQDQETRAFIYDFINKHRSMGGDESNPPPVVPPRGPPRPPSGPPRPAPPPPPSHTTQLQKKSKPPSPPKPRVTGLSAPPPPPPPPSVPIAPPPPSVPAAPPPPPPMMINDGGSVAPDANAALMQSIRNGTTLKSVDIDEKPVVEDARGDLLSEIRKGIQLKPVDEREVRPMQNPSPTSTDGNDLARALKMALLERSKVIHSEDDDDDTSSSSNDDEWDD